LQKIQRWIYPKIARLQQNYKLFFRNETIKSIDSPSVGSGPTPVETKKIVRFQRLGLQVAELRRNSIEFGKKKLFA